VKLGINLSIDVKSIDKARLQAHQNGKTYLNMTVFVDPDDPDQYGQHGKITQDVSKEEREAGTKGAILGNAKVFWTGGSQQGGQGRNNPNGTQPSTTAIDQTRADFDDDIPF